MELSTELRHLKMRNVPAAQTVAQRPSALKCFFQSRYFNWAQIGPQVTLFSRFAFPFVGYYKDIARVALQSAQVFAQLRIQTRTTNRACINVGHAVGSLNQRVFVGRPRRDLHFICGLQTPIATQHFGAKAIPFGFAANLFIAQQARQSVLFQKLLAQSASHLMPQNGGRGQNRIVPNQQCSFVEQQTSDARIEFY